MTGGAGLPEPPERRAAAPGDRSGGWPPHDVPSAADLIAAVREFLEGDVLEATEGRTRFLVRVAANALATVGRELDLGPELAEEHRRRLETLGVADDRALAAAIRSGALDGRAEEVRAVVRATVADKLRVANPRYLEAADTTDA